MNSFEIPKNLEVRFIDEDIGYGVFTKEKIKKGEIVEMCYGIEYHDFTGQFLDYIFIHPVTNKSLLVLGYGMVYNHDKPGNMVWKKVEGNDKFIVFTALRDIEPNEELRHDYGYRYWKLRERKLI